MSTNLPVSQDEASAAPMLERDFGLALMTDEKVLLEGKPDQSRLFRYFMLSFLLPIFTIPLLPLLYFIFRAYINKHRYWLTNTRVVVTNGIIGYRARSIPLERVSDVAISCNFLERAMGLRSVVVRDMTGEALNGATMMGAADATGLQQRILNQVHAVNRTAPASEADRMTGTPYREIEAANVQSRMLEVLARIEKNTRPEDES